MQIETIYDRALDWFLAVGIAVAGMMARAYVKIWRQEERIKALEETRNTHSKALVDLSEKLDRSHNDTRQHIDSRFEEIRDDLRIIMNRCLTIQHRDG